VEGEWPGATGWRSVPAVSRYPDAINGVFDGRIRIVFSAWHACWRRMWRA